MIREHINNTGAYKYLNLSICYIYSHKVRICLSDWKCENDIIVLDLYFFQVSYKIYGAFISNLILLNVTFIHLSICITYFHRITSSWRVPQYSVTEGLYMLRKLSYMRETCTCFYNFEAAVSNFEETFHLYCNLSSVIWNLRTTLYCATRIGKV